MEETRLTTTTLLLALAYSLTGESDDGDTASRAASLRLSAAKQLVSQTDTFSVTSPHAVHAALLVASEVGDYGGALRFIKTVIVSERACAAPAVSHKASTNLLHVIAVRTARSLNVGAVDDHLSLIALLAALPCAEDQRFSLSFAGLAILELARALLTTAVAYLVGSSPSDALTAVVELRQVIALATSIPLGLMPMIPGVDFFSPQGVIAPVTEASTAVYRDRLAFMRRRPASQQAVDIAYIARSLALSDAAGVNISRLISHVSRYAAATPTSETAEETCRSLVANSDGLVADLLDALSTVGR